MTARRQKIEGMLYPDGSTLIGDHKTAVQALEDVLACTSAAEAKETAKTALKALGEPGYSDPHETTNLTTRKQ